VQSQSFFPHIESTHLNRLSASSEMPTSCGEGADVAGVARHLEVSEQTYHGGTVLASRKF
jgi:hypothetical protein